MLTVVIFQIGFSVQWPECYLPYPCNAFPVFNPAAGLAYLALPGTIPSIIHHAHFNSKKKKKSQCKSICQNQKNFGVLIFWSACFSEERLKASEKTERVPTAARAAASTVSPREPWSEAVNANLAEHVLNQSVCGVSMDANRIWRPWSVSLPRHILRLSRQCTVRTPFSVACFARVSSGARGTPKSPKNEPGSNVFAFTWVCPALERSVVVSLTRKQQKQT